MSIRELLSEPLLHFTLLGVALFALYGLINTDSDFSSDEIIVDQALLSRLAAEFEKTWQRPPNNTEEQSLIDGWVREEILFREGLAMGFDKDDPVIKRRVAQKVAFMADGMIPEAPEDAELEAWLRANIEDYTIPATYSLRQVYIDPQRHNDDLDTVFARMLKSLNDTAPNKTTPNNVPGDTTLLPAEVTAVTSLEIQRIFGREFAAALENISAGNWQGPIRSGYGLHLVQISERVPATTPDMEEVRSALERDVLRYRSEQISEAFYAALQERYQIRIEHVDVSN